MSRTAGLLARAIGLEDREAELIESATPIHDIGKIGIPDAILHKPEPLVRAESRQRWGFGRSPVPVRPI